MWQRNMNDQDFTPLAFLSLNGSNGEVWFPDFHKVYTYMTAFWHERISHHISYKHNLFLYHFKNSWTYRTSIGPFKVNQKWPFQVFQNFVITLYNHVKVRRKKTGLSWWFNKVFKESDFEKWKGIVILKKVEENSTQNGRK